MLVSEVKGICPKKAELLKQMGIVTLDDMLSHYPHTYEDRSKITPLAEVQEGMNCYIRATVEKISSHFAHGRRNKMMRLLVSDDTGTMEILFFQASFYERSFHTEAVSYTHLDVYKRQIYVLSVEMKG